MELHRERNQHDRALQQLRLLQTVDQFEQILVELVQLLEVSRIRLVNRRLLLISLQLHYVRKNDDAVATLVSHFLQSLNQHVLSLFEIALGEGE